MSKLSQIEQKIREVCPWLMKLDFGCEVKIPNVKLDDGDVLRVTYFDAKYGIFKCEGSDFNFYNAQGMEILGHPIQLQHVLQALYGKEETSEEGWSYIVGVASPDLFFAIHGSEKTATWDLTKPLSEQSEELCDFIHQLICK